MGDEQALVVKAVLARSYGNSVGQSARSGAIDSLLQIDGSIIWSSSRKRRDADYKPDGESMKWTDAHGQRWTRPQSQGCHHHNAAQLASEEESRHRSLQPIDATA